MKDIKVKGIKDWNQAVKSRLAALAEPKYGSFSSSLMPGVANVLGVRRPALRALAKEIADDDWRGYLAQARDDSFEEILLQGLVIGYGKPESLEEFLRYVVAYVPKIDNWASCDNFCSTLKYTKKHLDALRSFIEPYLTDSRAYYCRFGAVMLLSYYSHEPYIDSTLAALGAMNHQDYYVKMAVAWALSVCFVHCRDKTLAFMQCGAQSMDSWTYNKAIQKIIESYRVSHEDKELVRSMRRSRSQES